MLKKEVLPLMIPQNHFETAPFFVIWPFMHDPKRRIKYSFGHVIAQGVLLLTQQSQIYSGSHGQGIPKTRRSIAAM